MVKEELTYTVFEVSYFKSGRQKNAKKGIWRVIHNLEEDFLDTLFHAFGQHANPKYYTVEKFASFVRGKNKGVYKCFAVGRIVRIEGFTDAFNEHITLTARIDPEAAERLLECFQPGIFSEAKEKDEHGERMIEHMGSMLTIPKRFVNWRYEYEDDDH